MKAMRYTNCLTEYHKRPSAMKCTEFQSLAGHTLESLRCVVMYFLVALNAYTEIKDLIGITQQCNRDKNKMARVKL